MSFLFENDDIKSFSSPEVCSIERTCFMTEPWREKNLSNNINFYRISFVSKEAKQEMQFQGIINHEEERMHFKELSSFENVTRFFLFFSEFESGDEVSRNIFP